MSSLHPEDPLASLPTLTEDTSSWKGASLLSVTQITPAGLDHFFTVASSMRHLVRTKGGDDRLKRRLLATVFYEASTRTACSFQAAMCRLGGNFLHVDAAESGNSSVKKGESLSDTMRCMECYVDVCVLRHPVQGSVGKVIQSVTKPVLNAGDGVGEHPTQALLDVFTIVDELHLADKPSGPLVVTMLGDLKHGRTVHSLAKLLGMSKIWQGQLTLRYCSPSGLEMPEFIQESLRYLPNVVQENVTDLAQAVAGAHVLYVTRIQRERFASEAEYEATKGSYTVDERLMELAPPQMMVLHPLPRVDEIDTRVDRDPRAAYFRQMENGMYVRMALLALVLGAV